MNRDDAFRSAAKEANNRRTVVAVVRAPLEVTDESGPFGFCPLDAINILFRHSVLVGVVLPDKDVRKFQAMLVSRLTALAELAKKQGQHGEAVGWLARVDAVKNRSLPDAAFLTWLNEEGRSHLAHVPRYSAYLATVAGDYSMLRSVQPS